MKKAAAYGRVSSESQIAGTSMEDQRQKCEGKHKAFIAPRIMDR